MGKVNNITYDSGFLSFRFSDENGDELTFFKINPSDVGLMARCEEIAAFFEEERGKLEEVTTPSDIVALNELFEQKINYLLDFENDTVFKKPLTATTIMPDGRIFAELLLSTVLDAVRPEIEKRAKAKNERLDKYVSKYKT